MTALHNLIAWARALYSLYRPGSPDWLHEDDAGWGATLACCAVLLGVVAAWVEWRMV